MSNILYTNEIKPNESDCTSFDSELLNFWREESFLKHEMHWQKKLSAERLTNQSLINKINESDTASLNKLAVLKKKYFNINSIQDNKNLERDYLTLPFLKEFDRKTSTLNKDIIDINHSRDQLHETLMDNIIRTFIKEVHNYKNVSHSKSTKKQYYEYIREKLYNISDLKEFYTRYTALFRANNDTTNHFVNYIFYISDRINNNYDLLKEHFQLDERLTKIDITNGDKHEDGKSVAIISFGKKELVFKPKNLYIVEKFYKLISYLNKHLEKDLYIAKSLFFEDFCIEEKINYQSCKSIDDIKDYYFRFGSLLGIIYMLNGNDIHYENIIAYKSYPIIIDLETLFNNQLDGVFEKDATNKIKYDLASSIIGTGMLPRNAFPNKYGNGFDLSALGSKNQKLPVKQLYIANDLTSNIILKEKEINNTEAKNIPMINEIKVNPYDYREQISQGLKDTLNTLMNLKGDIIKCEGILNLFRNIQVRTVIRNTDFYSNILFDSSSPDKSSDVLLKEMVIDRLYVSYLPKKIIKEEKLALLNNDIPIFYTNTTTKDLYIRESVYTNMYTNTPFEIVRKKFKDLDRKTIQKQCNILNDLLLANSNVTPPKKQNIYLKDINYDDYNLRGNLITEEIENLLNYSYMGDDEFKDINWVGMRLTSNDIYEYNALNINYSDGLSGIFQLLLYEKNPLLDDLIKNSILRNIKIHDNFFSSYYGVLSSLKVLIIIINRYNNAECIKKVKVILDAYISDVKNIFVLDFFNGLSGILSLLRDVYYYCQNFDIKNQIRSAIFLTEKQILNLINKIPENIGFSHGTSGLIYGLLRGYEVTNNSKSLKHVKILIERDENKIKNTYKDFTLSHGLVGVLLSRALYKKHSPDYHIQSYIDHLKENYCFNNHSICNGASGFVEVCNILEDLGFDCLNSEKAKIISHLIKTDNFLSGFPSNINSWSLLLGKTGLLYVLKRSIDRGIINVI